MADKTVPPIKIINRRFVTRNIANPTPTTSTETINMSGKYNYLVKLYKYRLVFSKLRTKKKKSKSLIVFAE